MFITFSSERMCPFQHIMPKGIKYSSWVWNCLPVKQCHWGLRCFWIGQIKQHILMSVPGGNGHLLSLDNSFHYHTKIVSSWCLADTFICAHIYGRIFIFNERYRKGETEVNSVHPYCDRLLTVPSCPSKCVAVLMEVRGPVHVKNQCEAIMISRTMN